MNRDTFQHDIIKRSYAEKIQKYSSRMQEVLPKELSHKGRGHKDILC